MSGLKTGRMEVVYDPTPKRLADLESDATKLDAWLERNGSFIRRHLGEEALKAAREARRRVDECIDAYDPDAGFDCYGDAWRLFRELYPQAQDAKERERRQQQRIHQKAAAQLLSECRQILEDPNNQRLLQRWAPKELHELCSSLRAMDSGAPHQRQQKAKAWQERFDQVLLASRRAATQNAKAVQEHLPRLMAVSAKLSGLNVGLLADAESFHAEQSQLQEQAEDALENEELQALVDAVDALDELAAAYEQKVGAAAFERKKDTLEKALRTCGYSVTLRTELDGTVVFQASSFPFKSVSVEMSPETNEMKLDVNDERGKHCVEDVKGLQAELCRQGVVMTITDWGKGSPQGVYQHTSQNLSVGGAI